MHHLSLVFCFFLVTSMSLQSQQPSSAEIYEDIKKLNFLGSVLYIAAHPDDENTRLISYMSNAEHARTAYLSLTRGGGGQNLIGTEIRSMLGVLRSQELLMARQTDGGKQFFSRAIDFGYSKHPNETLRIWNKDEVLGDVVSIIRHFKPDVIINRFDHRTPGRTHGHHTSSAMLSVEAFDLAADPSAYPEQLNWTGPWQPSRLFFNTSWWFYGSRERFAEADKSRLMSIDVGTYYPTLGTSNTEIAALSRSKHRSQGFGSAGVRGSYQEYLEIIKGEMPGNRENIFEGLNTTWSRVNGGTEIGQMIEDVLEAFKFNEPSASVPALMDVYSAVQDLDDAHWKAIKSNELREIIKSCLGLYLDVTTGVEECTPGDSLELSFEAVNRSSVPVVLESIALNDALLFIDVQKILENNTTNKWDKGLRIPVGTPYSSPFWLDKPSTQGLYDIGDYADRLIAETRPAFTVDYRLQILGQSIVMSCPVTHKSVDPASGEIRKPLAVVPLADLSFGEEIFLFPDTKQRAIEVGVSLSRDNVSGRLSVELPEGWYSEPLHIDVRTHLRGLEQTYIFNIQPPQGISEGQIKARFEVEGYIFDKQKTVIEYDHIPQQTVLTPAIARVVRVPMAIAGDNVAYLMGAGDKVAECLQSVGYTVDMIDVNELNTSRLSRYDALIIGVRAYNTIDELALYKDQIFDYVKGGGTVIAQYNTSRGFNSDKISIFPLKLSRNRVTDEFAEMRIIAPEHRVFHFPNTITQNDFDGWVQERGLYFPGEWDDAYTPVFSCNDPGEEPNEGSTLIAAHGQGHFVYTSLSWFRQLPAGVPGAYRFFANMIALSSNPQRP